MALLEIDPSGVLSRVRAQLRRVQPGQGGPLRADQVHRRDVRRPQEGEPAQDRWEVSSTLLSSK